MKINWKPDFPGANYSSMTGYDENGNKYYTPANMETVGIETPDGKKGFGWTAEEALRNATSRIVGRESECLQ